MHSIGGGVVDQGKKMGLEGRAAYAFGIQSEKEKIASDQRRRKGGRLISHSDPAASQVFVTKSVPGKVET